MQSALIPQFHVLQVQETTVLLHRAALIKLNVYAVYSTMRTGYGALDTYKCLSYWV